MKVVAVLALLLAAPLQAQTYLSGGIAGSMSQNEIYPGITANVLVVGAPTLQFSVDILQQPPSGRYQRDPSPHGPDDPTRPCRDKTTGEEVGLNKCRASLGGVDVGLSYRLGLKTRGPVFYVGPALHWHTPSDRIVPAVGFGIYQEMVSGRGGVVQWEIDIGPRYFRGSMTIGVKLL